MILTISKSWFLKSSEEYTKRVFSLIDCILAQLEPLQKRQVPKCQSYFVVAALASKFGCLNSSSRQLLNISRDCHSQIDTEAIFNMPHNQITRVPTIFSSRRSIDSSRDRTRNLRLKKQAPRV
ncbi:hypothetical protein TNCV_92691 [Trichonephila clavipes]|nr:hypothetical protein TNCV_92691 [Trichonephila clavipes]